MSPEKLPYGRQDINQNDIDAVCRVLESDLITQGPVVGQFEEAVAGYCSAAHAVAVNSATSALHIACLALGVCEKDTVWTTPNTFVASANCVRYCGADVDFVDIDPKTYNMCPQALASRLEMAKRNLQKLPSVVIVVHFAGQSCDMKAFAELAMLYDFRIIEDASHAVGASYQQQRVGSCVYSDIAVFSFHPVKIITSAEGGMAVTNCASLAENMRLFRSHGVFRPEPGQGRLTEAPWSYEQIHLGYNYRMTDVHAALGQSQMQRLDEYVARRQDIANRYNDQLSDLPFILPVQEHYGRSALHLYPILVADEGDVEAVRLSLFKYLQENGLGVNVHYIPVHTQPYYEKLGFKLGDFPAAERYYARTLSLPIFGSMSDEQQDRVVGLLRSYCNKNVSQLAA